MFYQFVKMKFLSATLLCSIIALNLREGNLIIHISQLVVVKFTTGLINFFPQSFYNYLQSTEKNFILSYT